MWSAIFGPKSAHEGELSYNVPLHRAYEGVFDDKSAVHGICNDKGKQLWRYVCSRNVTHLKVRCGLSTGAKFDKLSQSEYY